MSFYRCGGGATKWPKFLKRIDSYNDTWEANDIFDVKGIQSVTVKYQTRNGSERIVYGQTDNMDINFYHGGSNGTWVFCESTNGTATVSIEISEKYPYLAIATRRSGKMIYEFISVT